MSEDISRDITDIKINVAKIEQSVLFIEREISGLVKTANIQRAKLNENTVEVEKTKRFFYTSLFSFIGGIGGTIMLILKLTGKL